MLKHLIKSKKTVRILEVHNPISALIVEKTKSNFNGKILNLMGFGQALD